MKKLIMPFTLVLSITILFAFTNASTNWESMVNDETKSEFKHSTQSELLNKNIALAFSHLLDQVEKVDVHHSSEHGYYYMVYGHQAEEAKVLAINVSADLVNESYFPTLQEMGVEDQENLNYATCYWQPNGACTTNFNINYRVCGFTVWGLCIPFDILNKE